MFAFEDAERAFCAGCSRTLRRRFGRRREAIPVFTVRGVVEYPTTRPKHR